jgi:hypothetical protein
MSILTILNEIPLYSTQTEAIAWASSRNLTGLHTHKYNGVTGYMGGSTHIQAISSNFNITSEPETLQTQTNTETNINQNSGY